MFVYHKSLHLFLSAGEEFDSEAFMNRFVERFLESVDSHAIVTRLEIEYVISKDLSYTINHSSVDRGNEELLLYLRKHADAESIGKLCDVMISKEAYRAMQKLGKDMKEDLAKLTGKSICVLIKSRYMCPCKRIASVHVH